MKSAKLTVAFAACLALLMAIGVASAAADFSEAEKFGLSHFSNTYERPEGGSPLEAGGHPDLRLEFDYNENAHSMIAGQIRDIQVDQPAGFYGNPRAIPTCEMRDIVLTEGFCNPAAQVGVYTYSGIEFPVYNMRTPDEQTDILGILVLGVPAKIVVSVRSEGDYGLTTKVSNINQGLQLTHTVLTLWGKPADPIHDPKRYTGFFEGGASAGIAVKPFLTMPARCEPVTVTVYTDSWQNPGARKPDGSADFSDPDWKAASETTPPLEGCDRLGFAPSLTARPTTTVADSPSGLESDLTVPQNTEDPTQPSSAMPKRVEAILPEGLVINPSGGNGLGACTPAQIGLTTPVGVADAHFDRLKPTCPDSSALGRAEAETPVFADPLKGRIYAMSPYDNPFNSLLGVYLVFEGHGVIAKQPGLVSADPTTGQLTATFDPIPQQPLEHIRLNFDGGATAILRTPATCGKYATTSTITPWSSPLTPTRSSTDEYSITSAPKGSCASSASQLPNTPSFDGGSVSPLAGQYKPFVVNLRRDDGTQQFSAVTLTPPPGLVAKLKGTPPCSDQALAAAGAKSGRGEQASASCPAASQVGQLYAAAGAGPAPFWAPGKVYLAGPYKGAPLSFAFVVPAVSGPFDLGTVVTRAAVKIDPVTAEVTTVTDPLPQILKGIPLDVRAVSVRLEKPDFTLNPTSCDPMKVGGSLLSTLGNTATLNNRFQLAECGRLGFKPKLTLSLKGGTKRGEYPALTAVLKNRAGDANISSVQVALPHSEFLAQNHIGTICTRVQWAADACPKASVYGTVKVETPILDYPLTGNVYLRASSNPLPDLVPDLRGPASQPIRFEAAGKTDSVNGGLRNTFGFVPDVPFSKLTLKLKGGKKGLLQNSRNICTSTNRAQVNYAAHNGASLVATPALKPRCRKAKRGKPHSGKRGGKH